MPCQSSPIINGNKLLHCQDNFKLIHFNLTKYKYLKLRSEYQMNETINLLQSHRSIRQFQNKEIEVDKIKEIIKSAQFASTSSFLQAYSIIRVKNEDTLREISKIRDEELLSQRQPESAAIGNQNYIISAPLFLIFCADLHRLRSIGEYKKFDVKVGNVELLISATVDASLAAQNAMIAAESLGLGGVYVGAIRNNPQKICELLNIPTYVYPVFGMSLGYPDQKVEKKPRLPVEVIYHEDKYNPVFNSEEIEKYDSIISDYYSKRSTNRKDATWTQQIPKKLSQEWRPFMKDFLESKGFYF